MNHHSSSLISHNVQSTLQQISLKHPAVRAKLGLPDKADPSPSVALDTEKMATSILTPTSRPEKLKQVSVQDLSPKELLVVSDLWLLSDITRVILTIL